MQDLGRGQGPLDAERGQPCKVGHVGLDSIPRRPGAGHHQREGGGAAGRDRDHVGDVVPHGRVNLVEGDAEEAGEVAAVGANKVDERLGVDGGCGDGVAHESGGGIREEGVLGSGGVWVDGDFEVKHPEVGAAANDGFEVELVDADMADAESSEVAGRFLRIEVMP